MDKYADEQLKLLDLLAERVQTLGGVAIADSRQADVLEVLLDSVYTETPQLSLNELRAPEPGKAALNP
jgi:DNA-binding ferritin-like protein